MADYNFKRRPTHEVKIGNVKIGATHPISIQSMTNTPTADAEASAQQAMRIAQAGGEIVRLTAQGIREAQAIGQVKSILLENGIDVPLVADIHFNPQAAFAAVKTADKVRINPGNFVDPGRVFKHIEYTDEEYAQEIEKIRAAFEPLIEECKKENTALRIGVNHGSLSDRIMSRYGNTPAGMVESAMEFLRICKNKDFKDVVISIKASNVRVMVKTVQLLANTLEEEGMTFPLHLGVTEAGEGEDARIKSALGIGTLLALGLGDTIRVSLCEDPECEIPVAREIVEYISSMAQENSDELIAPELEGNLPHNYPIIGLDIPVEKVEENSVTVSCQKDVKTLFPMLHLNPDKWIVVAPSHPNRPAHFKAIIATIKSMGLKNKIILKDKAHVLRTPINLGESLLRGLGDAIWITQDHNHELALALLQAARIRMSKTEYIACPSCGRTMFDLQSTLKKIKDATAHLKGLKIGVMGCIVNGPGEMADADYGYVGSSRDCINLYKGKECVEKNIPQEQGVERLIALIKENGDWKPKEQN